MSVKKTVWQPLVLGTVLGLLAGIATATGLSFLTPGTDNTDSAVGFWMTLILLSAALGGPLAGTITSTVFVFISTFFGPPDMQAILSERVVFWSNLIVIGMMAILVGFAYRLIFERLKMPARLLPWAGTVIAVYAINPVMTIPVQFYVLSDEGIIPAILGAYRVYLPQAIFDIFITSLVFVALPARYRRPLWYKPMKTAENGGQSLDELINGAL
jgi:MFS family permease